MRFEISEDLDLNEKRRKRLEMLLCELGHEPAKESETAEVIFGHHLASYWSDAVIQPDQILVDYSEGHQKWMEAGPNRYVVPLADLWARLRWIGEPACTKDDFARGLRAAQTSNEHITAFAILCQGYLAVAIAGGFDPPPTSKAHVLKTYLSKEGASQKDDLVSKTGTVSRVEWWRSILGEEDEAFNEFEATLRTQFGSIEFPKPIVDLVAHLRDRKAPVENAEVFAAYESLPPISGMPSR